MGCACKNEKQNLKINLGKDKGVNLEVGSKNVIFKFLLFTIAIPILLLAIPYIIYILFNAIVLDRNGFSVAEMVGKICRKVKTIKINDEDDEDESEDVDYTE